MASVQQLPSLEAPLSPLSSRPKRSVVERSLCGCTYLEMFFDRASMDLRALLRRRQWLLFSKLPSLEAPLSPLSSRPKRSVVERSLCGCTYLEMFFDRASMDLRALLRRRQWLLFSKLPSLEAPLSPLSSRPKRNVVERSLCG